MELDNKYTSTFKIILLVFIYYVMTSLASLALGMIQPRTGIPEIVIELTQFGPTLGVLTVLLLFSRGHRPAVSFGFILNFLVLRRLISVMLLFVVIFGLAMIWYKLSGHSIDYTRPSALSQPFWLIIVAQFIGAAGEEFGWRCFMLPLLQTRFGVRLSSVIVGLFWGIWHIGVFSEGWLYASFFILSAIAITMMLGELLRDARGNSLWIATTFHALINLGLLLFFNEESGGVMAMAVFCISCAAAAIALPFIRAGLAKSSRVKIAHTNYLQ